MDIYSDYMLQHDIITIDFGKRVSPKVVRHILNVLKAHMNEWYYRTDYLETGLWIHLTGHASNHSEVVEYLYPIVEDLLKVYT